MSPAIMEIVLNGEPKQVVADLFVADLLAELGLKSKFVAVERNRELVPRARHAECRLAPGDRVEIVTLVGGG